MDVPHISSRIFPRIFPVPHISAYFAEPSEAQDEKVFLCRCYGYNKSEPINLRKFGTRHRSAYRFCMSVPGSLAFIISQDGDIRVMHSSADDVFLWDGFYAI